jgi:CMP-N,N'-diacetyllegionaminic acid synthase
LIGGKRVLLVVPARGGSQGIKLKNLQPVGGTPLVSLAGKVAQQLELVDRAIVSTDHPEIARVAASAGLAAPFVRPEELSGPVISDWQVLSHALAEMERIDKVLYDIVLMLQPTSPSRTAAHVRDTVGRLIEGQFDAVWTVSPTDSKSHPLKQLVVEEDGRLGYYAAEGAKIIARQQLTPVYHRNGIAYAFTRKALVEEKTIMAARTGALIIDASVVNIDTPQDLELANRAAAGSLAMPEGKPGRSQGALPEERASAHCPVCAIGQAEIIYDGPVRAGVFGTFVPGRISRCAGCGLDQLQVAQALDDEVYRTGEYREMVGETKDARGFLDLHDGEQLEKLPFVSPHLRRGAVVADIGCGGGAFLDLVKGLAGSTLAIELTESFHASLRARGHRVFPHADDCARSHASGVDLAVSFSVIEHVPDPVQFLRAIGALLRPSGRLVISTPNRNDLLMKQGLPDYQAFFYRLVHRFYFDAGSLRRTCERAGLEVVELRYQQRFGFSNFANWLAQKRPTGRNPEPLLSPAFDKIWRSELERDGVADYLYLVARRRAD